MIKLFRHTLNTYFANVLFFNSCTNTNVPVCTAYKDIHHIDKNIMLIWPSITFREKSKINMTTKKYKKKIKYAF